MFLSKKNKSRKQSCKPTLELLETREVMSSNMGTERIDTDVSMHLNQFDQLIIDGSDDRDVVSVSQFGREIRVSITQTNELGSFTLSDSFNLGEVRSITFKGKGGNDEFRNTTFLSNFVYGGDGHDTIYGGNSTGVNFLNGGAGNDYIQGGRNRDEIRGMDGNDRIYGGGGDDVLHGDAHRDYIYGGSGHDTIFGGDGGDWIWGNSGRDTIRGGRHNDRIFGGSGNDKLYGEHGDDRLFGEDHDDRLYGGDGHDYLSGGNHNDKLYGNDGLDTLYGNAGDDYLNGARDGYRDKLVGGAGKDKFEFHKRRWWFDVGELDNFVDLNKRAGDRSV